MKTAELATVRGPLPAKLGNAVSDAIHEALAAGMRPDEAASIAIAVVVDYAIAGCGAEYTRSLGSFIDHKVTAILAEKAKGGRA